MYHLIDNTYMCLQYRYRHDKKPAKKGGFLQSEEPCVQPHKRQKIKVNISFLTTSRSYTVCKFIAEPHADVIGVNDMPYIFHDGKLPDDVVVLSVCSAYS